MCLDVFRSSSHTSQGLISLEYYISRKKSAVRSRLCNRTKKQESDPKICRYNDSEYKRTSFFHPRDKPQFSSKCFTKKGRRWGEINKSINSHMYCNPKNTEQLTDNQQIYAVFLTRDAGGDNKSDFSSFNVCSKEATASSFDADQSLTVLLNRNIFQCQIDSWYC